MSGQGKDISLSVEETNRLRVQLGLRPLRPKATECALPSRGTSSEPIHAPPPSRQHDAPPNASSANQRPRLSVAAAAVLGLNDDDDDDEDEDEDEESTSAWIERLKQAAAQKTSAVGNKRPRTPPPPPPPRNDPRNGQTEHLTGTRIQHSALQAMADGEETILTLADSGVLNDTGYGMNEEVNVLVNTEDREKVAANNTARLRSGAALADLEYDPTDNAEFREKGGVHAESAAILRKYDQDTDEGGFRIAGGGEVLSSKAELEQRVAARLQAVVGKGVEAVSAAAEGGPKFESDFLTKEQFAAFKTKKLSKSKKKKRKRESEASVVENVDARPAGVETAATSVRKDGGDRVEDQEEDDLVRLARLKALRAAAAARESAREGLDEDEDGDTELHESLARARRAATRARGCSQAASGAKAVFQAVAKASCDEGSEKDEPDVILTEAEQFVRTIGPSEAVMGERDSWRAIGNANPPKILRRAERSGAAIPDHIEEDKSDFFVDAVGSMDVMEESKDDAAGAPAVATLGGSTDDDLGLSQPMGLAQTLARLRSLGELKKRRKEQAGRVRDERVDWTTPGGGREVQLSYKDDQGRDVTPKEAFRIMSHKFHGKGPGQNKREAAMRRQLKNKELRESAVADDAPLASVVALQEETKKTQSAHVVLSGAAAIRDAGVLAAANTRGAPASAKKSTADVVQIEPEAREADADKTEDSAKRSHSEGEFVSFSLGNKRRRH